MAQTPDQTRREIEETRIKIAEAAEELEERFEETTDWKKLVGKYPFESVAIALGVGFIISAGILSRVPGGLRTTRRALSAQSGIASWARPMLTPIITRQVLSYISRRSRQR